MTHKEAVEIAYKWVLNNGSCGFAFKELVTIAGEIPDVIGFGGWDHSIMIEVKVTRSDFLADRKKVFRIHPHLGVGKHRAFCCPTGLIKKEELPEGWGLIYISEKGKAQAVHLPWRGPIETRHKGFQRNIDNERSLMYSALRRLHLRGLIKEIYTQPTEEKDVRG